MLRPVATIVSAILLSRPAMDPEQAEHFAKVLQTEAKEHGFDPLTVVAMVHFESGWNPAVVSQNGEDYGLGQVRARFIGACRDDTDPLTSPSAECQAVKRSLLEAETNLRTVAQIITDSRKLCLEKTGSAALPRWLASYQGLNFPSKRRWCQPGEKTWRVIKYRNWLLSKVVKPEKRGKPKTSATRSPARTH
jgi:hypothetical protein